MPYKPKTMCKYPGCPGLAERKYCDKHKYLLNQEKKGNTERGKLYNTARWKALRSWKIRVNPLCEECQKINITKEVEEVDHIIPHKGDTKLFFEAANLQSLCKSCHSKKTMRETLI